MRIVRTKISSDKTKKYFFDLKTESEESFNSHIEACLLFLPRHGDIICVSSQLGCSQRCAFCASGVRPFVRNLSPAEIEGQVRLIVDDNPKLRNGKFQVTYMGSGEPLSNWDSVFTSIDDLRTQYKNLEKVNISTIWPFEAMKRYRSIDWAKYVDFLHFQFSLHFPDDEEREKYFHAQLPTIQESLQCLEYIAQHICDTYRINYIPFDGVNDSVMYAKRLATVMERTKRAVLKVSQMCHVSGSVLSPSSRFDAFAEEIKQFPCRSECFKSDGMDIHAGCGQFYNDSLL